MCVFIYTLSQLCHHRQFQNVCECATARGAPETETSSLTLEGPKFLFDTSKSNRATPEYYKDRFACKKRKAIRPVPTMCVQCLKAQVVKIGVLGATDMLLESSIGSGSGSGSLGSSVGLVPGSESSSSDMTDGSGASTPRSIWKLAHPVEMV